MPEARDRLSRPGDEVTDMYIRRRTSLGNIWNLADDDVERSINWTQFRWGSAPLDGGVAQRPTEAPTWTNTAGARREGGAESTTQGVVQGRRGQDRRRREGHGGSNSVLPSWYPRSPLRDITDIVRAIERRRAHLGEGEGHLLQSPEMTDQQLTDPDPSSLDAQLEQDVCSLTQTPTIAVKTCEPSSTTGGGESGVLTPTQKLLNSIDVVEKVVMEELHRLSRTPTAKKAERERKVRTLMSMR